MSKYKPLVTIGLIAYNRSRTLGYAIQSLLSQSYKEIELVISDDASTDDTASLAREFSKKDKRIRFYRQKKNLGLPHNSNFVLSKARGKYFMWAADDDTWHPSFIETLVNCLERHSKAGLAMCNFDLYNNEHTKRVRMEYPRYSEGVSLVLAYLSTTPLLVWGLFRTKVLLLAGGFHTDSRPILRWGSDNVTVFRVLLASGFCFERRCLWHKRDSGFALDPVKGVLRFFSSEDIRKRVFRYLTYPIMFFYDYIAFLRYSLSSSYSIGGKVKLVGASTAWFLRVTADFIYTLLRGLFFALSSLFLKPKRRP